jgi:hypothetical protein
MNIKNIYAEFRDEAKWAFVPAEKGRWIRTHPSALFQNCSECGQQAGRPCLNDVKSGVRIYQVPVHGKRVDAFQKSKDKVVNMDDEGNIIKLRRKA